MWAVALWLSVEYMFGHVNLESSSQRVCAVLGAALRVYLLNALPVAKCSVPFATPAKCSVPFATPAKCHTCNYSVVIRFCHASWPHQNARVYARHLRPPTRLLTPRHTHAVGVSDLQMSSRPYLAGAAQEVLPNYRLGTC